MASRILILFLILSLFETKVHAQDTGDGAATAEVSDATRASIRKADRAWKKAKQDYQENLSFYYQQAFEVQTLQNLYNGLADGSDKEKVLVDLGDARTILRKMKSPAQLRADLDAATQNVGLAISQAPDIARSEKLQKQVADELSSSSTAVTMLQKNALKRAEKNYSTSHDGATLDFENAILNQMQSAPMVSNPVSIRQPEVARAQKLTQAQAFAASVTKGPSPSNQSVCEAVLLPTGDQLKGFKNLPNVYTPGSPGSPGSCRIGNVIIGDKELEIMSAYNPLHTKESALGKAYLTRTGLQKCDTDTQLAAACQTIGDASEPKIQVGYVGGNCVFPADASGVQAPLISAKGFCLGPMPNGQFSMLAHSLGFKPVAKDPSDSSQCDPVYAEVARLVLQDPKNIGILKQMTNEAAAKFAPIAAHLKGNDYKTAEGVANALHADFKAQHDSFDPQYYAFNQNMIDLYTRLGAPEDVDAMASLIEKTKKGADNYADYYDGDLNKTHSNQTSRLLNHESSALLYYISTTLQKTPEGRPTPINMRITMADAAAVWAQGKLYDALQLQAGSEAANLNNFSTQVYKINNLDKTAAKASQKAATPVLASDAIAATLKDFSSGKGATSDPELLSLIKSSNCLLQDHTAAGRFPCSLDGTDPKLGAATVNKIKEAISIAMSTQKIQGLAKKYTLTPHLNGDMLYVTLDP